MGYNNVNLAALIGSRICHDLISPIGAITNGLELLDMAGTMNGPELDLIADSVGNAGARIRFFRIAYGGAGDQMMGRPEIVSVLDDVNQGARIQASWGPLEPQARRDVRLAFLALQCCETAMAYGGTARVTRSEDTWHITGSADKLNIDPELWSGLTTGTTDATITPALVQFALLPTLLADEGRALAATWSETDVALRFPA